MSNRHKFQESLVGPVERFDQRNDMFRRSDYDPKVMRWKEKFYDRQHRLGKLGYTHELFALADASWYLEDFFAKGNAGSNQRGLYAWKGLDESLEVNPNKVFHSPGEFAEIIKKAAAHFGAALVGVCELNEKWLYSHVVDDLTGDYHELDIPNTYRYAIALGIEMDHELIGTSPAVGSSAATGLGYSKMAFVAGLLAQFIRGLGYQAIPCGNDTALSIPIAVEAGLGELGRNGLLITEKFGPRVRLCKIFTDMPLIPDSPRYFGVEEFCQRCKKCAQLCPSQAIPYGDKTTQALTMSNNSGVLKWMVNPEQCYHFWSANRSDCATCIRVCPFNQPSGWHHDLVRFFVKNIPPLDPFFLWLHDKLYYAEQKHPDDVWNLEDD